MGIERYRWDLEVKVKSKELREVFERLKSEHKIFEWYPTAEDLCGLLTPDNKSYADKDKVMAILLGELHKSTAIYPLINLMFWESLRRLFCQRRSWVADPQELFSIIQWSFYHCLSNHDLKRLPRKIDVNIYLNTRKKVIAWERENLRYKDEARSMKELCNGGLTMADLAESTVHTEEIATYLMDMVSLGVINETQYDIIMETLIRRTMNMREWSEKSGISYNTVRTLKMRAETALRAHSEKSY